MKAVDVADVVDVVVVGKHQLVVVVVSPACRHGYQAGRGWLLVPGPVHPSSLNSLF